MLIDTVLFCGSLLCVWSRDKLARHLLHGCKLLEAFRDTLACIAELCDQVGCRLLLPQGFCWLLLYAQQPLHQAAALGWDGWHTACPSPAHMRLLMLLLSLPFLPIPAVRWLVLIP